MSGVAWRGVRTAVALLVVLAGHAASARAETRFALIVAGATGGQEYVEQYARQAADLSKSLVDRMKFDPASITVLSETDRSPASASTAVNVRRVLASIRERMTRDDLLFLFLIGHGTFDGVDAKFNLVGPDMESGEWAALIRALPGRVVAINTSAASFPFVERLAGPRRIIVSATDSAAQSFDTVFADYFIRALGDEGADIDKNGRISVWEAFAAASAAVARHYQQRGQLATERAILDDNGDGVGKQAADQGEDGSNASRTYLDESLPGAAPTDDVLLKLLQRKATLESEVDDLKIRRTFLQPAEYAQEFERLMVELAKVSHDIRERRKSH